mmetsp:Transcript_18473/g.32056  ORF Transcript_18473/g.32056 Transcript_18473/m.32056 type:complete len:215 (+) Transcript_18473:133-777(+)|eukprot:CAMPEP_0184693466 /NCGR_PEP_ID=MMETSP0313-20130426/1678_1 /TAXON_ID=2792 /ORGANISM="Porphyridium aerugineum, Strain SAG 1380-2" /LENGTH=214 /DNA_ID=CAMNT_0027151549 /DNA_START=100 /DNA_END=744 /DNA_ORIENTATION=+
MAMNVRAGRQAFRGFNSLVRMHAEKQMISQVTISRQACTAGYSTLCNYYPSPSAAPCARFYTPTRAFSQSTKKVDDDEESDPDFQPKVKKSASESPIFDRIKKDLEQDKVVLYMKGLPSAPQCGFSLRTVQILRAVGVEFRAYNVLANPDLREGVKQFSNWPTIPQLFVNGEFVGGCDIAEEMFQNGSLVQLFIKAGAKLPPPEPKASEQKESK